MTTLSIDIETYSSVDLIKSGVYKYVEAPDFEVLMIGFALKFETEANESGVIESWDNTIVGPTRERFLSKLQDPSIKKTAYNANFELTCLQKYFRIPLDPDQWECTQVKAAMLGLPMNLEKTAEALKLEVKKDTRGKALIRYFSIPCKPTKTNGERTRNLPHHDPEKWQEFKDYCMQDVKVEQAIAEKISFFTIPETEKKLWNLDQKINARGVMIDKKLVVNAVRIDKEHHDLLIDEASKLTSLENPNSVSQLKAWLESEMEEEIESLNKKSLPSLLGKTDSELVKRVVEIRQELSKTSIKKYVAMLNCMCSDGAVRGLAQYYGANRTGRWSGRLIQLQNLARSEDGFDMNNARELTRQGNREMLEMLFENVPNTLSQLIRTALVSRPGHTLWVADFAAIEARVMAWFAKEQWRLDLFSSKEKKDIYIASASQMFKVPIEKIDKKSPLRQKGKVAELACQYGSGPDGLIAMGALDMGLTAEELPDIIAAWRKANKKIVKLWGEINAAAILALQKNGNIVTCRYDVQIFKRHGCLFIKLPSGRSLSYVGAHLTQGLYGPQIEFWGMNQTTRQWEKQRTWGSRLLENIIQAIARDCLSHVMVIVEEKNYPILFHVHDELVGEKVDGEGDLQEILDIMSTEIPWAPGLPLAAAGFESKYYKKD